MYVYIYIYGTFYSFFTCPLQPRNAVKKQRIVPGPWPVSSVPDAILISMPLSPLLNTPPTLRSIIVSLRGWMSSFLCILPNLRPPKKRKVVLGDSEKLLSIPQMISIKGE